jgi:hypothetical protein
VNFGDKSPSRLKTKNSKAFSRGKNLAKTPAKNGHFLAFLASIHESAKTRKSPQSLYLSGFAGF